MTPKEIDLKIEFRAQTWYVTSPQIPGLLATGGTMPDALEHAAIGIRNLALAFALAVADGEKPKPIFHERPSR